MGITKEQLVNTTQKIKNYVDQEVGGIEIPSETTYTDEEINTAIDAVLQPSTEG